MFKLIKQLNQAGVLGINQRNCDYTLVYNQRKYYPLVDDKLQTKQLAQKVHIAIPELYAVIEFERQLYELSEVLQHHSDFVLKPAHGSGGNGIIVLFAPAVLFAACHQQVDNIFVDCAPG